MMNQVLGFQIIIGFDSTVNFKKDKTLIKL